MDKKLIVLKSWAEFLKLSDSYEEKLQKLKVSPIAFVSTGENRVA